MTQEITVLNGAVRLRQSEDGFRTCIDSVLLAASCPIKPGQSLLDIGCGVGGAMFCVAQRVADISICGVDVVASVINLAKENADLNAVAAQCEFECADIRRFRISDPSERYDHVICNPPYMEDGKHLRSPKNKKAIAHGNIDQDVSIRDWINCAFDNMRPSGSLSVIHRADQTDKIIQAMGKRFGAIEIVPLWPKIGVDAKRVIIRAIKDRKTPSMIRSGLVLHENNGDYTKDADLILRKGKSL